MAGSNASVNLTGLFSNMQQGLSDEGRAGREFVDTFRNMMAPQLDMNDPASMSNYANYLDRNGRKEEAMALMAKSAELTRQNNARKGEASIMAMAARLDPDMEDDARRNIMSSIAAVAEKMGVSPLAVGQILDQRELDRRATAVSEADTASLINTRAEGLKLDKQTIDNNLEIAKGNLKLGVDTLAETMRSNFAQEGLSGRGLDINEGQFAQNLKQRQNEFSLNYGLEKDRFEETQRMNTHGRKVDNTRLDQDWKKLSLEDRRVVVAEQLKDNEISFTEFRQLMMGEENDRLNEMQPWEIETKKASIQVALANAGYTEAQTERALYDLGFEKSVRSYRQNLVKNEAQLAAANVGLTRARTRNVNADTARTKKDIDRIIADTKRIRAATDFHEASIEGLVADMKLNRDKYNLDVREQNWSEGIQESQLRLQEMIARSGIKMDGAQIENLNSLIGSRTFQDNMLAWQQMSTGITEAQAAANALTFDPLNETAVNNARKGFLNAYGAGALVDFDQALKEKINLKQLQVTVRGLQMGLEDKKPPTKESLRAARFSDEAIETIMGLPPAARNQAILGEATRLLEPETGGSVTQAHLDITQKRAEKMFYATFGEDWLGPLPTWNGVWDDEVIEKVNWALAEANVAGKPPHEAVNAGVMAMLPYLERVGGGAIENLDSFIKSMGGD